MKIVNVRQKEKNNIIIGEPKLINSKVHFSGQGNILFCDNHVILKDSIISFSGNNSLIFLSENKFVYKLQIEIFTDCSLYFGKNNHMTNTIRFIIQEYSNIVIGNNNTFATNVKFRTSDAHPIYDINLRKRINPSGNTILGDHIWICADVNIFKNCEIGSGSIIGSNSLLTNKKLNSNSLYAGTPIRELKTNVCYDSRYVGNDSVNIDTDPCLIDDYIFQYVENELLPLTEFKDNTFSSFDIHEKIDYFKKISKNSFKNRFYRNNKLFEI